MKKIILTIIILISSITLQAKENDKIKIITTEIESINISVNPNYFVAISLENEIVGFNQLELKGLRASKLDNKTIVVSAYESELPVNLGKIIITDKNCNKYGITLKLDLKNEIKKDKSVYINNSNKNGSCEANNNKTTTFPMKASLDYASK